MHKGQTDQDTGQMQQHASRSITKHAPRRTPVGLNTGITQAKGREKSWGGQGSPPFTILSPGAEETQTDGQKDRDTESRPGTC